MSKITPFKVTSFLDKLLRVKATKDKVRKEDQCYGCKREMTNPEYILKELTTLGYMNKEFCSLNCLIKHLYKEQGKRIINIITKEELKKNGKTK